MKTRTILILCISLAVLSALYYSDHRRRLERLTRAVEQARLLPWPAEEIKAIELTGAPRNMRLEKRGADWWLVRPVEERADQSAIARLVEILGESGRFGGVDVAQADLQEYGLLRDALIVRIEAGGDPKTVDLMLGSPAVLRGDMYMTDSRTPLRVFVARQLLREAFERPLVDFRDKSPLPFRANESPSFRISSDAGDLVFEKRETVWAAADASAGPPSDWHRANGDTVKNLLEAIQAMPPLDAAKVARLEKLPSEKGNPKATARITAPDEGASPREVEIRFYLLPSETDSLTSAGLRLVESLDAEKAGPVFYAEVAGRDIPFEADPGIVAWLSKPFFDYRDRLMVRMDVDEIDYLQIELSIGSITSLVSLERKGDAWIYANDPAKRANTNSVLRYLSVCMGVSADEFLDGANAPSEAERGLDKPLLRVNLANAKRDKRAGFEIGLPVAGRHPLYHARRLGEDEAGVRHARDFALRFSEALRRELLKTESHFEWLGLFDPEAQPIAAIDIHWGDENTTLSMRRQPDGEDVVWLVALGAGSPVTLPDHVVDPLIRVLQGLDFERQVVAPSPEKKREVGLLNPKVAVTLRNPEKLPFAGLRLGLVHEKDAFTLVCDLDERYYEISTEQLVTLSQTIQLILEKLAP
jgi:hypothetical protein